MRNLTSLLLLLAGFVTYAQFSLEDILKYPFPADLVAAQTVNRIAWTVNERGKRNVYVAEGPAYAARKLTSYEQDDGQEISSLSLSADGKRIVYVRGGEHGSNWDDDVTLNPLSMPFPEKVSIWSAPFAGGAPLLLAEGENPVLSPDGLRVVFAKNKQLWSAPVDSSGAAKALFSLRGNNHSPVFSPDGTQLAFVSSRGDHSYIGIYRSADQRIQWVDPGFDRDVSPRWSPDGQKLVFIRRPGLGGAPEPILEMSHIPWFVMVYHIPTKQVTRRWKAPETPEGSLPGTHGGTNLHWAADNRIVFLSYHDGWPHLYSMDADKGAPLLLTPGDFMVEYLSLSPDKKTLIACANTGTDGLDTDRRHIVKVSVNQADMEVVTPGTGNEWAPQLLSDGSLAYLSATARRPPLPAILSGRKSYLIGEEMLRDFPSSSLVIPRQVIFKAPDGLPIHATWFEKEGGSKKKPAIIYVHGGPPRQMLLGWHYSSYYANAYAVNQYLARLGFIVIAVNYRLGIGYGHDFQYPPNAGWRGASEYQDIKAAGEWLSGQPGVDPGRIGIYGGSYGGFLTALALGKDSDLFAAGVDIHGVHDRTTGRISDVLYPDEYERAPDAILAPHVMWQSSPVAYVDSWTSPVLIIHGDDDRNVPFSQSVDLVQRLRRKGVDTETLAIVDDSHHFMVYENQKTVNQAIANYLVKKLNP